MAAHRDEAGRLLHRDDRFSVLQAVGERDLDLHVLAGLEALDRLRGVHLRRRREDHRVEAGQLQGVGELGRHMADAVCLGRGLLRLVEFAPDERDDLDPVDQLDAVEMLEAEGAGAASATLMAVIDAPFLTSESTVGTPVRTPALERPMPRVGAVSGPRPTRHAFSRMRWPTAVFDAGTW